MVGLEVGGGACCQDQLGPLLVLPVRGWAAKFKMARFMFWGRAPWGAAPACAAAVCFGGGGGRGGDGFLFLPHMSCEVHQRPGNAECGIM